MEFGKVQDISHVDFSLAADHPGIKKILGGKRTQKPEIFVGLPEWVNEGFLGKIYPLNAQSKDFVKYYGKQFNSVELNATLYRIPELSTVKRWRDAVPENFRFCPKIHQSISHSEDISQCKNLIKQFHETVLNFENKLGTCFLQLPPVFGSSRLDQLLDFLDHCPIRDLAIELRHESWFGKTEALDLLCNYMYKNNLSLVLTDVAGRRDVSHQRLTNKTAFIRFVANNVLSSDYKRMDDWLEKINKWLKSGLERLYFFIHAPDKSMCPELSIYFINHLNKIAGIKVTPPMINENRSPELF
jgi:uncharacterized protein YecE (DUF72 family)